MGSKWPTFTLGYLRGFPLLTSDVNFDRVEASIQRKQKLGVLGTLSLYAEGGTFLNRQQVYLPGYFHFSANQTLIRNPSERAFNLMKYYDYSTSRLMAEVHAQQSFGGFLLSKVPILKKLKLQEHASVNFAWTEEHGQWLEAGIGLERKFFRQVLPLRLDYFQRIMGDGGRQWGVMLTVPAGGGLSIGK